MKKLKPLVLILTLCILTLFAVYMFRDIRYVNGKGNDYLVLSNRLIAKHKTPDNMYVSEYLPDLVADSLSELILKIKTGNFTDLERYTLVRRMHPDEQGRVIIPDLQSLIKIIPPKSMTLSKVYLEGGVNYRYIFSNDSCNFSAQIFPNEEHHGVIDYNHNWSDWPSIPAYSTSEEIKATVPLDDNFECKFQVHTDSMVFYVVDDYSRGYDSTPYKRYAYAELRDGLYLRITTKTLVTDLAWLSEISVLEAQTRKWLLISVTGVVVLGAATATILTLRRKRRNATAQ